jgi:hypothetical protein
LFAGRALGSIGKSSLSGGETATCAPTRAATPSPRTRRPATICFNKEQFEVYRALGFHIAIRLLNGGDELEVFDARQPDNRAPTGTTFRSNHPPVDPVRSARL